MRRRTTLILLLVLWAYTLSAQIPVNYYLPAEGKSGSELRSALHNIIDDHIVSSYTKLWTDFQSTDRKPDGKVWDMYSDKPGLIPPYTYTFVTNQCGNYDSEADCYNREHSFPKSWFGGEVYPMYSDLFHLFPTDGWVNNKRGNFPFGPTSSPTWTSMNGSKLGPSSWPGYTGVVFEPIDAYKGDFARAILYMGVRYYTEDSSWPGSDMVTGSTPNEWAKALLLKWHSDDPVSQKEIDRNNAVHDIQENRNPFIDRPEFAALLWGTSSSSESPSAAQARLLLYPVPARDNLRVVVPEEFSGRVTISFYTLTGKEMLHSKHDQTGAVDLDISTLPQGAYIVTVWNNERAISSIVPVIR